MRIRCLPAAVALGLSFVMMVTLAGPASAAPAPAEPVPACVAAVPGLSKAPVLKTHPDLKRDGTPVTVDPAGDIPVLLVHGWTGRSTHNDARTGAFSQVINMNPTSNKPVGGPDASLVGRLQDIPRTAVYTFDYPDASARWVTDDAIGLQLKKAIDCLYSLRWQKVVIIGHSMGGLATRFALGGDDPAMSARIRQVITFGTPNTGSVVARLGGEVLEKGAAVVAKAPIIPAVSIPLQALLIFVRAVMQECGQSATESMDNRSCQVLPDPVAAFDSEAGRALRSGSPELANLADWPGAVDVTSLAGSYEASVQTGVSWFGLALTAPKLTVSIGDLIVLTDSATWHADHPLISSCKVNISAMARTYIWRTPAFTASASADFMPGACFHGNLMANITLAGTALNAVADDTKAAPPSVAAEFADWKLDVGKIGAFTAATDRQPEIGKAFARAFGDSPETRQLASAGACIDAGCKLASVETGGPGDAIDVGYEKFDEGQPKLSWYSIDYSDNDPDRPSLPRTTEGIGAGSTVDEFNAAYPPGKYYVEDFSDIGTYVARDGRATAFQFTVSKTPCSTKHLGFNFDVNRRLLGISGWVNWDTANEACDAWWAAHPGEDWEG